MPRLDEATRQRIINLAFAGLSRRAIVREVGCCKAAVDRAVRVYRDERSIGDAPRSGRPPATSLQDDILIIAAVNCDPSLSLSEIRQELGLQVSRHTIRRRLNAAGLRSRVACQRLLLNEREKRAHLDFTREHVQWGNTEWSAVIFSDESTFVTRWDQRQRVWRLVGSRYDPHYIQQVAASGRCAVSVWGALSQQGLGPLHRIDRTLTADKYQDIIEQVLIPYTLDGPFPDGCFLFQHDRSPIHTARAVRKKLEELGLQVMAWPPKGADLNIIECVWGFMKRNLSRRAFEAQMQQDFWAAIEEEWNCLREDPNLMANLYASLPRRVQDVVDANGAFTRH